MPYAAVASRRRAARVAREGPGGVSPGERHGALRGWVCFCLRALLALRSWHAPAASQRLQRPLGVEAVPVQLGGESGGAFGNQGVPSGIGGCLRKVGRSYHRPCEGIFLPLSSRSSPCRSLSAQTPPARAPGGPGVPPERVPWGAPAQPLRVLPCCAALPAVVKPLPAARTGLACWRRRPPLPQRDGRRGRGHCLSLAARVEARRDFGACFPSLHVGEGSRCRT